jgi:iron(III) transport system substrate-binding protein
VNACQMAAVSVLGLVLLTGCGQRDPKQVVVVYTALDQIFSEKVLGAFEQETGIDVKPVYDTEATKTVGLVNRILAEKDNPQCDVFWNNEVVRTVMLKRRGVLQTYASPSAADIPAEFKDAEGYWHGFAARARILVCNTSELTDAERPSSIEELTEARWRGKITLANPVFGTTATHAAALFASWGDEKAKAYYRALKANDVLIVDSGFISGNLAIVGGFRAASSSELIMVKRSPKAVRLVRQVREQPHCRRCASRL